MASEPAQLLATHLRKLSAGQRVDCLPDRELVRRFAARRDEEAFAALVRRHGPMVLRACRRVLHDPHVAEDVFQAVFLVLIRKAASLRHAESIGSWLYGVAYRLALKMRAQIAQQHTRESRAVIAKRMDDPLAELSVREAQVILGEELGCLPEKYRAPLVLCYLEGHTRDEAARSLGWPVSLVKSRLEQGRERLRLRLSRRGLSLSAALLATLLTDPTAPALSPVLIQKTLRMAVGLPSAAPAQVVTLADGAMKGMGMARWKLGVSLVVLMGVLTVGAGVLAYPQSAAKPEETPSTAKVVAGPRHEDKGLPRTDSYGDPLPPHALARLGTVRLRPGHQVHLLACLPDNKSVLSVATEEEVMVLSAWRLGTGELLRRFEAPMRILRTAAICPDGKTLVTLGYKRADGLYHVELWDIASEKRTRELTEAGTHVLTLALTPDGKTLATAADDKSLHLWDLESGTELRRCEGAKDLWDLLAFSPDGKVLVSASSRRRRAVQLWDVATGRELRALDTSPGQTHAVVFSPDGKMLATANYDEKVVRLWDAGTGKVVRQFRTDSQTSVLAFSPDGKILAAGGEREEGKTLIFSPIHLWDVPTGRELHRMPGHLFGVGTLAFSGDGKRLVSGSVGNLLRVWDVATGKDLLPFAEHQSYVNSVAFSPDGRFLATGGLDGTIRLWEPRSGQPARLFERGSGERVWRVVYAPDGRTLVSSENDGSIRFWDVATGRQTRQLKDARDCKLGPFAPDGRTLAVYHKAGTIQMLDAATGEERQRLAGVAGDFAFLLFSPKGERLVSMTLPREGRNGVMQVWDPAAGKELHRWTVAQPGRFAFCPDGRTLVMGGGGDFLPPGVTERTFHVWDLDTGEDRSFTARQPARVFAVAVSPDGRMLAWGDTTGTITLWDLAASQVRRRLQGHISYVESLDFSPDGKTLASGSADTTALLWDVTGRPAAGRTGPLSREQLQQLWDDLASKDAGKAFDAIGLLSDSAEKSVPMLKGRLRPVPASNDRKEVVRLIAELDSDRFEVRQKAMEELRRLRERAEPGLRSALESKLPLEARKRVEELLQSLRTLALSPEQLRGLRAVEVLEHIGTPEARQVLQTLAEGSPEARLTREVRAALDRLARRR